LLQNRAVSSNRPFGFRGKYQQYHEPIALLNVR
jgi:hypothetical protein